MNTSSEPSRRRFLRGSIGLVVVLGALGTLWYVIRPRPPVSDPPPMGNPDPRLTYAGPFQNIHPDVQYVGDARCVSCHKDQADACRLHPMGNAMAPVASARPMEKYDATAHNPFAADGLRFQAIPRNGKVFHREWAVGSDGKPMAEIEAEVRFTIGSGAKARSYAIARDGFLFQSSLTWYVDAKRWDLSPSYDRVNQHFNRPIAPGCLFCHCTAVDHVPGTLNRYREPIVTGFAVGCERCHGPGEKHVRNQLAGAAPGADSTIVNPKRLEHDLREAVCQQCHVQGEQRVVGRGRGEFDFRPGLPLHPFLMDFVDGRHGHGEHKFVNSTEEMMASRCYRESRDPKRMGCTSCHDAHAFPSAETRVSYYRSRCLECHTDQGCSIPLATRRAKDKQDSCVACHMPRTGTDVSHTSLTDHTIPRKAEANRGPRRRATAGPLDLVPFHRHLVATDDPEVERNRGIAIQRMLDRGPPPEIGRQYSAVALPLLDKAVERDPDDFLARRTRAEALFSLGRKDEGFAECERLVETYPEDEVLLHLAGDLALDLNRLKPARDYLARAAKINPYRWPYWMSLARASFRSGEFGRAADECRQGVRLDPAGAAIRSLLIQSLLWDGRRDQAEAEYHTLRQLTAEPKRLDLARWFASEQERSAR